MRILHLLHRSTPGTHGYAVRSREIVIKQLAKGLEPIVITSPSQAPLGKLDEESSEYLDDIRYFRSCSALLPATVEVDDRSTLRSTLRVMQNVLLLQLALRVARAYRPAVIHAHSPFTCGLVARVVGRVSRIPTVYEMRGIWEESHAMRHRAGRARLRYQAVHHLENRALKRADACCVICESLKTEALSRGVLERRIFVVPNGVDHDRFQPGPGREDLRAKWGLCGAKVMGYVGSFSRYEGLELLIEVTKNLRKEFSDLHLLLVGDGDLYPKLQHLALTAGLSDRVVFTGRLEHKEVLQFYRLCDFLVLPRRDTPETRLVTPLKPLEIMAVAKPLIASDIGGHREMIEDGINGLLFRSDDTTDLTSRCRTLIQDPQLRVALGSQARQWVIKHRDWDMLVERYIECYQRLTSTVAKQGSVSAKKP
jgi:PEP-CTERM/exosortase A-associated glycosyltransferase